MKKIIETIKKKWIKDTLSTIIMFLLLLALVIGINVLTQALDIPDIDVTKNQLFTLSESSKNQIKAIEEEIKIYLIGFDEDTAIVDLSKQYTKQNSNIQTQVIADINQRADLKVRYGITDETQLIIIETAKDSKVLTIEDLYTYDYTNYQQIDISEEKITNAIVDLTKQEKPKIYFLTGHNEYSLTNELTLLNAYLTNEVNDVKTLDLLVNGDIPDDTNLLVIGSPQKDFIEQEVELINNYIKKGGKILWLSDPMLTQASFPNMQKILDQFGVTIEDGIILEQDENKMALQSPNYIIPNIATTNATKNIATDGGILLVNATKLTLANDEALEQLNIDAQVILTTSNTALFRKEVANTSPSKISSDEEGSFIIGVKLDKTINQEQEEKKATMYVISNNFFVADYPVNIGNNQVSPISFYNNKDYILNTIAELTENENAISIRKDTGIIAYTATEAQDKLIKLAITIFPISIITIGIVIWIIRKRKK
ncbi:MAG: GldG family protein [Clostridia bacterium]|nr:GldG family protein [Clostridia bacterium]